MKYLILAEEEQIEVDLISMRGEAVEARVGSNRYQVEIQEVEPGVFWVQHEGRSAEISLTRRSEGYAVGIDHRRLLIRILDPRERLRASSSRSGGGTAEVRALMPGRVVEVLVTPGTSVADGQGLLVIEAMKMQNETQSPLAGRVERVLVEEGAAVNAGDLLATIVPDG
jgi:biotin carboxyl carrier protein